MKDFEVFNTPLQGIHLIEASAGTGKTWNICALYLRLLLERDLPVKALLVVTFTNAATAELATRIRRRLQETLHALTARPANTQTVADPFITDLLCSLTENGIDHKTAEQRLQHALHTFDEAAIFTIHGFCQRMLTDIPFSSGQSFSVEMIDDDESILLEATHTFWREEITRSDKSPDLARYLAEKGDSPESWLKLLRQDRRYPLATRRWDTGLSSSIHLHQTLLQDTYTEARNCWEKTGTGDGVLLTEILRDSASQLNASRFKPDYLESVRTTWAEWFASQDPLAAIDPHSRITYFSADFLSQITKKNCTSPSHPFFTAASALLAAYQQATTTLETERMRLLQHFLSVTPERVRKRKQALRQTGFDDMLWNAYTALHHEHGETLSASVHSRYPVALVDEFQDTDPLQLAIFRRIYHSDQRHGTLFLVGDPKQAIYSFRGADLFTYLDARQLADTHTTLRHNQRSSVALIDACNRLFSANPHAFMLEGLSYPTVAPGARPRSTLTDRSAGETCSTASLQLWQLPQDTPLARSEALQHAADATATEIVRLIQAGASGTLLINQTSLQPGDIAVLVRNHHQGSLMRQALATLGVNSVELSQESVYHSQEAEELERLLHAILEPARTPVILAALATTAMGWHANQIAALEENDTLLLGIIERFTHWHTLWLTRGIGPMLRTWMTDIQLTAQLLVLPDGERRLTNWLHLIELLQQQSKVSPEQIFQSFSRLRQRDTSEASQLRLESDQNLVQIITIHRAKGLEYNVVFCPFLFDGYMRPPSSGLARLWHDDTGTLILDYRHQLSESEQHAIQAGIRAEEEAEAIRLIYVALTRAIHRCYLVVGCYTRTIAQPSFKESSYSLLNWLAAGAQYTPAQWRSHTLSPDEILNHWEKLTMAFQPTETAITLRTLPSPSADKITAASHRRETIQRPIPPEIPSGWRIGSFTALAATAIQDTHSQPHHRYSPGYTEHLYEITAPDHDLGPMQNLPSPSLITSQPTLLSENTVLSFPRGANAGDCIHAILEHADFSDSATWEEAITIGLTQHPQKLPNTSNHTERAFTTTYWLPTLKQLLNDITTIPLQEGLKLCTISPQHRQTEMGFYLPSHSLSAQTLNDWLVQYNYPTPSLHFLSLKGYLKGYIDLVFLHRGQFFIADWKSNYLGDQPEDYGPENLKTVMAENSYHLQYLLYTLALHRHLQASIADYDYDTHIGGIFYLFVRGMQAAWQTPEIRSGIYAHRIPRHTLLEFDRLFTSAQP